MKGKLKTQTLFSAACTFFLDFAFEKCDFEDEHFWEWMG